MSIDRKVNIKIPSTITLDFDINEIGVSTGTPICYFEMNTSDFPESDVPKHHLKKCETLQDLELWWDINSDGRSRESQQASPLWPVIQKMHQNGHEFYIIHEEIGDNGATGFAISKNGDCFNGFGVSTRTSCQKRGFFTASRSALKDVIIPNTEFSIQANLDTSSFNYYRSLPNSVLVCTERNYVAK